MIDARSLRNTLASFPSAQLDPAQDLALRLALEHVEFYTLRAAHGDTPDHQVLVSALAVALALGCRPVRRAAGTGDWSPVSALDVPRLLTASVLSTFVSADLPERIAHVAQPRYQGFLTTLAGDLL